MIDRPENDQISGVALLLRSLSSEEVDLLHSGTRHRGRSLAHLIALSILATWRFRPTGG